jgi:hypothetical protein
VYSARGIFRDSNKSINCARLIFASSEALPYGYELFLEKKEGYKFPDHIEVFLKIF